MKKMTFDLTSFLLLTFVAFVISFALDFIGGIGDLLNYLLLLGVGGFLVHLFHADESRHSFDSLVGSEKLLESINELSEAIQGLDHSDLDEVNELLKEARGELDSVAELWDQMPGNLVRVGPGTNFNMGMIKSAEDRLVRLLEKAKNKTAEALCDFCESGVTNAGSLLAQARKIEFGGHLQISQLELRQRLCAEILEDLSDEEIDEDEDFIADRKAIDRLNESINQIERCLHS